MKVCIKFELFASVPELFAQPSKNNEKCYYFDSFGLDPPLELQSYLNSQIELSTFKIKKFDTHHCGYYCLLVLKLLENFHHANPIGDGG
jgi:hypothetical protein